MQGGTGGCTSSGRDVDEGLGCQDSNLGITEPKSAALPLGHTPSLPES